MISRTLLIAARPFGGRLDAERVCAAIAEGLRDSAWQADLCPIDVEPRDGATAFLRSRELNARMRAARAIVIAEPRLDERTLIGTVAFELATRARQGGVPAYGVTGEDDLDCFDARILDLQTILVAQTHRSLMLAGRKLAEIV